MNSSTAVAPTEPITARATKAPSAGISKRNPEASSAADMAWGVVCSTIRQPMTMVLKVATRTVTIFSRSW